MRVKGLGLALTCGPCPDPEPHNAPLTAAEASPVRIEGFSIAGAWRFNSKGQHMNYHDALKELQARSLALLGANTEYATAYKKVDVVAYRSAALSNKQKELIALLLGIVMRCDDCTVYHTRRCIDADITGRSWSRG
jgi:alkylhydroperoxidase/carboxymuconolactone decarboxylase family protein YurZ